MKHITRIISAGLSVIALLSCSAIGAGALSVSDCAQVKVITCGGSDCQNANDALKKLCSEKYGCTDVQSVLNKLGCDKNCSVSDLIKCLNTGCADSSCAK